MRHHGVVVDDDRVFGGRTRLMADRDQRRAVQRARRHIGSAEAEHQQHAQPDGEDEATRDARIMTNRTIS
jgi:hypothetical protein